MLLRATFVIEGKELTDDVELSEENLKTAILNFFDEEHSSHSWRAYSAVRDLEVKVEAAVESTKPKCPKCNCETIVMTISRDLVYEVNSTRLGEYKGENVLEADDISLIDTDETDVTIYSCTGTDCTFESEDLTDFNPN